MKTMFIGSSGFTLSSLREKLEIYSIYNGSLPTEIHMTKEGLEHYKSLLSPNKIVQLLTFHGILIKENE